MNSRSATMMGNLAVILGGFWANAKMAIGAPTGFRTPVFAVRGRRPRPLDDRGKPKEGAYRPGPRKGSRRGERNDGHRIEAALAAGIGFQKHIFSVGAGDQPEKAHFAFRAFRIFSRGFGSAVGM